MKMFCVLGVVVLCAATSASADTNVVVVNTTNNPVYVSAIDDSESCGKAFWAGVAFGGLVMCTSIGARMIRAVLNHREGDL